MRAYACSAGMTTIRCLAVLGTPHGETAFHTSSHINCIHWASPLLLFVNRSVGHAFSYLAVLVLKFQSECSANFLHYRRENRSSSYLSWCPDGGGVENMKKNPKRLLIGATFLSALAALAGGMNDLLFQAVNGFDMAQARPFWPDCGC